LHKKLCYDAPSGFVVVFNPVLSGGEKMAIIATACAVGTAVIALLFSFWMLKQLFTGN
jgi:hypothetical protein